MGDKWDLVHNIYTNGRFRSQYLRLRTKSPSLPPAIIEQLHYGLSAIDMVVCIRIHVDKHPDHTNIGAQNRQTTGAAQPISKHELSKRQNIIFSVVVEQP